MARINREQRDALQEYAAYTLRCAGDTLCFSEDDVEVRQAAWRRGEDAVAVLNALGWEPETDREWFDLDLDDENVRGLIARRRRESQEILGEVDAARELAIVDECDALLNAGVA